MDQMKEKLLENIKNSISETIKEKKIGIAFSGGVDSTLVAQMLDILLQEKQAFVLLLVLFSF